MKEIIIANHKVKYEDNVEELPISRYAKFTHLSLVASGVGNDITDIDSHAERAKRFIEKDPKSAISEINNLQQAIYLSINEPPLKSQAFASLITHIDGIEIPDYSDSGIKETLSKLDDKKSFFDWLFKSVKKKIDEDLAVHFPTLFAIKGNSHYTQKVVSRAVLQLEGILFNKDNDSKIKELEDFILTISKPENFSGNNSIELQYLRNFDEQCIWMSKAVGLDVAKFTTVKFFNTYLYLTKNIK